MLLAIVVCRSWDKMSFKQSAIEITKRAYGAVRDVVTAPAVQISAGNLLMASQTAEAVGIAVNLGATLGTAACRAYESWTGRNLGLPYYVQAGINAVTAGSILANGLSNPQLDIQTATGLQNFATGSLLPASAFVGWATGHILRGRYEARNRHATNPLKSEQLYYGIGDIAAVQGNPTSTTAFLLGLGRTFLLRPSAKTEQPNSFRELATKHVTPARLYATGYYIGSALSAITNPVFAAAQFLWGTGYAGMDKKENRSLIADIRKLRDTKLVQPRL